MGVLDELGDPRAFAERVVRKHGLRGTRWYDEAISDAMYGIARAVESWDPERGPLVPLVWRWAEGQVLNGLKRSSRRDQFVHLADDDDPVWLHARVGDPGFKQVEDRMLLQRWADMAHLDDQQADLLAWLAVHGGERGPNGGIGSASARLASRGDYSKARGALARMRYAAAGRAWRHTTASCPEVDVDRGVLSDRPPPPPPLDELDTRRCAGPNCSDPVGSMVGKRAGDAACSPQCTIDAELAKRRARRAEEAVEHAAARAGEVGFDIDPSGGWVCRECGAPVSSWRAAVWHAARVHGWEPADGVA